MGGTRTRREGFQGEHLAVLPKPLWNIAPRHPLLRGLCVTDAGYFPAANRHLMERPQGAPTTLAILCLGGRGWIRTGGADALVGPGDLVWLPAGEPHAYGARGGDPWTIVWAHFTGDEVEAWRDLLGIAGSSRPLVLSLPTDRLVEVALDQVHQALEDGHSVRHQVSAAAALRRSLSALAALAFSPRGARSPQERVLATVETMRRDWRHPHRLGELAIAANLSIAHFSTLFRQLTGFSPIDFLIRQRIQHACSLLDTTSMRVQEVAGLAGFQDAYYFARCFRRIMGCPPRDYRRMPKG